MVIKHLKLVFMLSSVLALLAGCGGGGGDDGTAGPEEKDSTWETKGSSFTAEGNKGYHIDGDSLVTITLPAPYTLSIQDSRNIVTINDLSI